jgi:sphinganine-1-phosphate aldolase
LSISIHLCFTANQVGKAKEILKDLADSIEEVLANPTKYNDGAAAIYGLAASVPDRTAVAGLALLFVDSILST